MFDDEYDPVDFCYLDSDPKYRLSKFERLTLTGGEELERAVGWIGKQLRRLIGNEFPDVEISHIRQAADFYGASRWGQEPWAFFVKPNDCHPVVESAVHGFQDGEVVDLSFRSAYQVQFPGYQEEFESFEASRTVYVRHWRHNQGVRPTIIAVHGWTMGDQRLNSLAFLPGLFYRLGLDVALIELPFHGRRKPASDAHDVEHLFPSSNIIRTNECMGQIISDLRQLRLYLDSRGCTDVGAIGMSLGAYVCALWAGLDELSFCIPMVPLVSIPEVAWEIFSRRDSFEKLKSEGLSKDLLSEAYYVHGPLHYPPKLSKDRALIIAGIGDRIIPPRQPKLLWQHWGMPRLQWMDGGHVAQFRRSKAFAEVVSFFRRLGYA